MKSSLTATELKRCGMAALGEALQHGAVHITKRNKPVAVVLSADDYLRLKINNATALKGMTAAQWLRTLGLTRLLMLTCPLVKGGGFASQKRRRGI